MGHCTNLKEDRDLGEFWEKMFCKLAKENQLSFTPMQIGRESSAVAAAPDGKYYTLPDITIWSAPGEHHEIKHKQPNRYGRYGLERYRFDALVWFWRETGQEVLYTIHDWRTAGGKWLTENNIDHWVTATIERLYEVVARGEMLEFPGDSYVNGEVKRVPICYWKTENWLPLERRWWINVPF